MTNKSYLSVYAKSFNWAGFFLPKETYQKCSALYDFCRVIDNIADDKESVEIKETKFSFCCKNIVVPIIIGHAPIIKKEGGSHGIKPKKLNIDVGSCADKSFIQPKKG